MKRLLVVLLLLVPFAHASTIEQAETTAIMSPDFVNISAVYHVSSDIVEDVVFSLPVDAENIVFYMNGAEKKCTVDVSEEESKARCGSTSVGANNIKLKYSSKSLLGNLEQQKIFKFTDKLPFKAELYKFSLQLPRGFIIPEENDMDFYLSPDPSDVTSDGRHIIVKWDDEDLTRFSNFAIVEQIAQDSNWDIAFFLSIAAVAAAFAALVILFRRKPKEDERNGETLLPGFIEDEQKVVELLQSAPNHELWQKNIQQDTGFSKAKVSRIVRNLEARGVVSKESFGNTNKIKLKNGKEENSDSSE